MKYTTLATSALLVSTANAFSPAFVPRRSAFTSLLKAAPDDMATELIKDAVAISEKYGKDSAEARLAWETVEEVNAADNSEATKGALTDECDVTEEWIDSACMEYNAKLEALDRLLQETKAGMDSNQPLLDVEPIKLADVPQQKAGAASPELKAAVENAKKMTEEHGIQSSEARVAWETVEEIASASERSDALGGQLTAEECLVDAALDTCKALEELNRAMGSKKA